MNFFRSHPLHRNKNPLKRTPLRKVSSKRAKELREYSKRRVVFLAEYPWCQIWLARHGLTEADVDEYGNCIYVKDGVAQMLVCPRSTEVHHKNGRNGWRLLDESMWCAASRDEHIWIKENQSEARHIGVLV